MGQPNPVFRGRIEHGRICLDRRDDFAARIQALDGKEIELVLRKYRRIRSVNQNAYFHGVIVPIFAEFCGYEEDEMKVALKLHFLWDQSGAKDIEGLPRVRSTADLTTAEFEDFCEKCRRLAAEHGCVIPLPGESE